ncbi:hypothetical protein [Prosthecomicrobium sp. N25]|uniref:hypothetical protein n=1 Tax=Prosthecomicrobium sp. N25 TaxID=3129254 RepID=UPI003077F046
MTAARIVDHVEPHKGDPIAFYCSPLQSLCDPCHSRTKQGIERRGYDTTPGLDGWPIDPAHPANRGWAMATVVLLALFAVLVALILVEAW